MSEIIVHAIACYLQLGVEVVVAAGDSVSFFYINVYAWHSAAFGIDL
jgi:hypothetical protein